MIVLGIDPGLDGALSVMDGGSCWCFDMPTLALSRNGKNKREVDARALADLVTRWATPTDHAFVELVNSMPGQGVASMFALGKGYGIIIGVLAASAVPMTIVSPRVWKRVLRVPAEKDGARARASQLIPGASSQWPLKKHDGRAESALIALYGVRSLGGTTSNA